MRQIKNSINYYSKQWHSWLRHRATSQRIMGSVLEGVISIHHLFPLGPKKGTQICMSE